MISFAAVSGAGWECKVASGATGFSCAGSRSRSAARGGVPRIAPRESVSQRLSGKRRECGDEYGGVSGGGGALALRSDPTTVTPAVPFGIRA